MNFRVLLVWLIAATGTAGSLQAQGTVLLSNYDSRQGIYEGYPVPGPAGDTFVEILGGPVGVPLVPLANSAGQGPVFGIQTAGVNALGPGTGSYFNAGWAAVPDVPPGGIASLELRAWVGGPSWDQRMDAWRAVWSQSVGAAGSPAQLLIPYRVDMFVPEPSAARLAALALAIAGVWRRRMGSAKPVSA